MKASLPFKVGDRVELDYTNYRGERSIRLVEILPAGVTFGRSKHHPDEQWFLSAQDVARDVERDFAMRDIHGFKIVQRAPEPEREEPPSNTIYRQAYGANGERVLHGARSSFEVSADCHLQDLAVETKYAIRRGNYNRSLLVLLLEAVCEKSPEWAFLLDVLRERCRQINEEGFDEAHDDQHDLGELSGAAAAYALHASDALHPLSQGDGFGDGGMIPPGWCWEESWWKPTTPERSLVKSSALLLAEGELLKRRPPDIVLP